MVRIAVVDDEEVILEQVAKIVRDFFEERQEENEVRCYHLPGELLCDLEEKNYYDIYFLDIEMRISGLELAKAVRQLYLEPYIIFVTAYGQYSVMGYEYGAFRYIVKKEMKKALPLALEQMSGQLKEKLRRQYVIESGSKVEKIDFADLYYIHIEGKYTHFYKRNGTTKTRKTLGTVFEELDAKEFLYTDKSYVINIQHVMKLKNRMVIMRDGAELPVSKAQYKNVKRAIADFWRGKI